ncbi:UDP-N-acetylglucosamine 2-epimerase [Gimesia alba]|nr:UDP-N-acetylglucosamine 2-epimerase [Gimesia alba]
MTSSHTKQQRILAVCYGGGHVLMLIPVLKHLKELGHEIHVLGLTTAANPLRKAGFSPMGFQDIIQLEETRAIEHGKRLAAEMHQDNKVNSPEESIAYLGLSYADLEDQLGVAGAEQAFRQKGRQAFLPLNPIRRIFDIINPDVVLTTNSPRAELASIRIAAERGIPSVGVLDLFGLQPHNDIPADFVCVPFKQAVSILVDRGLNPENLIVTGNPNFDWVNEIPLTESRASAWRIHNHVEPTDLLALYAMKPNWDQHEEMIVSSLEHVLQENHSLKVAVRPHPNSDSQIAERVINRLGNVAFLDKNTPLSMSLASCDALITHKSTVSVEAALLGKQVALFHSNHDYPTHGIPLHLFNWGTFSISIAEGIKALSNLKKETSEAQKRRADEVRKAWNCDSQSHIRITNVVLQACEKMNLKEAA